MWQRFVVVLMGPVMNWAFALVCFVLMFNMGFERPVLTTARVGRVMADSAAAVGGMQDNDLIVSISGKDVATFDDIPGAVQATESESVDVVVQRGTETLTLSIKPRVESGARRLGVEPISENIHADTFAGSLALGAQETWDRTTKTFNAFAGLLKGGNQKGGGGRLVGLPGIVKMLGLQIDRGLTALLSLLAMLSLNLCLFNLFPIPALDGSRLIFLMIEGIRHKRIDERIEGIVHTVGFVCVFGLILFASVRDLL